MSENRDKKRTAFLAHTAAGARIRADRTRDSLRDLGFDDDLPQMPADGKTPWGDVSDDGTTTPPTPPETAVAETAIPQPATPSKGKTPRNYPNPTPEAVAQVHDIVSRYRQANGEFA